MPPPEPYNIVNAIDWSPDIDQHAELFSKIIPDDAFIAASNYTEKTEQLWRDISAEIENKNGELEKCKAALEVAGIKTATNNSNHSNSIIPEPLIEAIANESKTKILLTSITAKIEILQTSDQDVENELKKLREIIEDDKTATEKCPESQRGQLDDPGWVALSRRIGEIESAFAGSKEPTEMFIEAAKVSTENLQILTKGIDYVREYLPKIKELDGEEKEAVELVTKLVSKIEEMESQRSELSTKLQSDLKNDDITGKLAGEAEHTHANIYAKGMFAILQMCLF